MHGLSRYKWMFLLPGLLTLLAIILFPLLFTIRVSLSNWDATSPGLDWAGGFNYLRLFGDQRYWQALVRLGMIVLTSVVLEYTIGFALALLIWHQVTLKRTIRVVFLIPMMTMPVAMAVIWRTIFHESLGPANDAMHALGLPTVAWLTNSGWATFVIIFVDVWQWTPFMFLLLLAGLLSLPKEPFLAAAIDGAGPVRAFFAVTFPAMGPISLGAILIRLIEASKILDTVYVITSGGPGTSTETPSYYIFIRGLRDFQIGYAASASVVYLVLMIVLLTIIAKLLGRVLLSPKEASQ